MAHTPGPWKWQGEDYRGGWGWQLLVDSQGRGIACGASPHGGSYEHLRSNVPIDAKFCKTGMLADKESAPAFHVRQGDASLIVNCPEMYEALQEILRVHANDDKRPKAFYIAAAALAKVIA